MAHSKTVTRFAPSPTGMLHVGGARTALFNWLYARKTGGSFRLRIEDTDRSRSTPEAREAIVSGLTWLGLDWNGDAVSQHARLESHREAAGKLLESGRAYRCFSTPEEIDAARKKARKENRPVLFASPWRNADPASCPDRPFTVRLRSPATGITAIDDAVCGRVSWQNETLDDMIIVRSDGTPTYNLAVVVDDREMGITHVIRGDDHLSNSARQKMVYDAFGWKVPVFVHIPLIHGEDGRKLSKRSGDLGLEHFRDLGIPPEAMRNYLARLGWSHGDDEFFTTAQAIDWFSLDGLRKSPARLDRKKLLNLSRQHLALADESVLARDITERSDLVPDAGGGTELHARLVQAMPALRQGARTCVDLAERARFMLTGRPVPVSADAARHLDADGTELLHKLAAAITAAEWSRAGLEAATGEFCQQHQVKFGTLAQPLRAALAGSTVTPSVLDMMVILGRDESLGRLRDASCGKPEKSQG